MNSLGDPGRSSAARLPLDAAADSLALAAYHELRRLAHAYLRGERSGHTLQTTALVHEAYLRLVRQDPATFDERARFIGTAAHVMRHILVDYARARKRRKRGGDDFRVPLDESVAIVDPAQADQWEALDGALDRLATLSARQAKIVELRYFGGLTVEEAASVLNVSPKTVKRDWAAARAWLRRELTV
jgi:RNA polymerase sigma-70 factor (ECF subfamily)